MRGISIIAVSAAVALGAAGSAWSYEIADVQSGGSVAGVVKLSGAAPPAVKIDVNKDVEVCGKEEKFVEDLVVGAGGGLKNAVVYLVGVSKGKAWPTEEPTLDQNGCRFEPHVALAKPDSDLAVLNSDNILHNLHSYSEKNRPFNVAQPKFKKKMTRKFSEPEFVKVQCDAHGWMQGYVVVQEHPYYAVTDATGAYKIENVPPGSYQLKVWHERLGEKTQSVTVAGGAEATSGFELALK